MAINGDVSKVFNDLAPSDSSVRKPPRLILDTSSGVLANQTSQTIPSLLSNLQSLEIPIVEIDTAPNLPRSRPGGTEALLGGASAAEKFSIDTKVTAFGPGIGLGRGELKADKVRDSLKGSLKRLRARRVRTLLAQRPDAEVSLGEMVGCLGGLVGEGSCEKWGVCGFPITTLRDILKCCERRGFRKPSVYQGTYNCLARKDEDKFAFLRANGIAFHASDPTASGTLNTRKVTANEAEDPPQMQNGTAWKGVYDRPEMRKAVSRLSIKGEAHGILPLGAGLRWLAYHSKLSEDDAIVLGGRTFEEVECKVKEIAKGPLPEDLVWLMEDIWSSVWDG